MGAVELPEAKALGIGGNHGEREAHEVLGMWRNGTANWMNLANWGRNRHPSLEASEWQVPVPRPGRDEEAGEVDVAMNVSRRRVGDNAGANGRRERREPPRRGGC